MLVTKPAPDFKAMAVMPDNSFEEVQLSNYRGQKVVLFFYPMDFTFVCPTEILAFDHRLEEFKKRNVQVLGCSTDSHYSHLAWKNTPVDKGGIGNIQYPLIADIDKTIARAYNVLVEAKPATVYVDEEGEMLTSVDGTVALRASFLIDEEDFDPIFGRIRADGLDYWADPFKQRLGEINRNDGGRGVYFADPNGHLLEVLTRPYGSGGSSA